MFKHFRLIDNIAGWTAFLIAAVVYCLTIEPTASFWDCPEFISTGYKLEVGHPPGAPFFMLTANLFSQFASDASEVARMVNTMSALLSAACILFLFWSISHLTRKLICTDGKVQTISQLIAVEASAMVGALIYTFSDTFWFSAVEGEVYAYSSAFTAVVFWLILKWEDNADKPHSDRWLVLIFYMTGLSIGVHLLNLLCIPAIVLVFYYKKVPQANLKGSLIALSLSFVLVAAVLYGVVPGIITVGGWTELLFVNVLGCPFNTGVVIYFILLVSTVLWAIYETFNDKNVERQNIAFVGSVALLGVPFVNCQYSGAVIGIILLIILWFVLRYKRGDKLLISTRIKNTALLCMLMLMIGYCSYAVIVIRSMANPPMDQNSPEDIFTLGSYLSRDQYGDSPLLYGEAFSSEYKRDYDGKVEMKQKSPVYQKREKKNATDKDEYFIVRYNEKPKYEQNMLFPRMHDKYSMRGYYDWMDGDIGGVEFSRDENGELHASGMPSMLANLQFFVTYQCNYMYWRYFMWNFAGRQNDIQGEGFADLLHGNWITGISFIDNMLIDGDAELVPDDLQANKGHNVFYCLPLLLGLLGLFWQAFRGDKGIQQFWVVFFLFFMTGLAIVLYLNQTPGQPRERDYAYAGSFYAFAIWCGMGVAAIIDLIKRYAKKDNMVIAGVVALVCLLVPVQMASQTWDDHDRSGRYTCRDFGQNYLMSLDEGCNPIIFTNGDNDTFPLWYNQDVEGVRTDARVCNLSYLSTDWYIDQMIRAAYDSPGLPINWTRYQYVTGTNEYAYVLPEFGGGESGLPYHNYRQEILNEYETNPEHARQKWGDNPFEIHNVMKWVREGTWSCDIDGSGEKVNIIPTDTIFIKVDKQAVMKSKMKVTGEIPDEVAIPLPYGNALSKSKLMMLELIANTNWTRPVYVATTVGGENFFTLGNNFVQEGLAYRITPFASSEQRGTFDTDRVYNNMMKRFKYGNLSQPGLYLDETTMRMCKQHKILFASLASHLIDEGKKQQAKNALAYMEKVIPEYNVPSYYECGGMEIAQAYIDLGMNQKGIAILEKMFKLSGQYVSWYLSLSDRNLFSNTDNILYHLYLMNNVLMLAETVDKGKAAQLEKIFDAKASAYLNSGGYIPNLMSENPSQTDITRFQRYNYLWRTMYLKYDVVRKMIPQELFFEED